MSKPTPDFTIDDMMDELGIVAAYEGPGAFTVTEMVKKSKRSHGFCRRRAEGNVESGKWVRVNIAWEDGSKRIQYLPAYVNKKVYEQYTEDSLRSGSIGISQENLG